MKSTMEVESEVWLLDATDRCDRCNAQAYVKVIGEAGELLFCSHHYNKIIDSQEGYNKIMAFMVDIVDERKRLEK